MTLFVVELAGLCVAVVAGVLLLDKATWWVNDRRRRARASRRKGFIA